MPTVYFQRPGVLIAMLAVPLLALLWRGACRICAGIAADFPSAGAKAGRNRLRGALRMLALSALIVGAAGPTMHEAGLREGPDAAPVVFILDLSDSMNTADIPPSRLARAHRAIRALCEALPQGRAGLVVCSTDATAGCLPTNDRPTFLSLLDAARTDWMSGRGTELASALLLAADIMERHGGPGAVVLISDGENHGPDPTPAIQRLRQAGNIVHTVVVGTEEGTQLSTSVVGDAVVTRARPEQMAAWAREGGGRAWRLGKGTEPVTASADDLLPLSVARAAARRVGTSRDVGWTLFLAAALLMAWDSVRGRKSPASLF